MPATRTIATLATAAALLLAACGGDGAATGATSTTATTAGPARTAGPSTTAPATCRNDLRIVNGEASEPVVPNGDFAPTTMWADKGPHPANTVTYDNSLELAFSTYERGPDPQFGYSIPADPDTPAGEHHVYLSLVDIADGLVEAGELFVGQLDAPDRPDADGEINFAFWEFGDDRLLPGDIEVRITALTDEQVCGEVRTVTGTEFQQFVGLEGSFVADRSQFLEEQADR